MNLFFSRIKMIIYKCDSIVFLAKSRRCTRIISHSLVSLIIKLFFCSKCSELESSKGYRVQQLNEYGEWSLYIIWRKRRVVLDAGNLSYELLFWNRSVSMFLWCMQNFSNYHSNIFVGAEEIYSAHFQSVKLCIIYQFLLLLLRRINHYIILLTPNLVLRLF